ncbi:hypothetical protein LINPERHAP1_LOCUS1703, partial [Linum perenne]
GFGHFVARFDSEEDYNRAFLDGPWLVGDHYVVSEEWRPNFKLGYSQVNTIRAWVRLPGLPLENFDVGILKLIGDRIGKTVRVDGTTLFGSRATMQECVWKLICISPWYPNIAPTDGFIALNMRGFMKFASFVVDMAMKGKLALLTLKRRHMNPPTRPFRTHSSRRRRKDRSWTRTLGPG